MTAKSTTEVYALSARTATPTAITKNTKRAIGMHLVIEVTAASATPSVVVTVDGIDQVSGAAYNLLTSAAITGVSTNVLKIHPDILAVTNIAAGDMLPEQTRVTMTHADGDSITYSVGMMLVEQ